MNDSTKLICVVLVSCIIAIGLFMYLIAIDKKVSKLEKQVEDTKIF